MVHPGVISLLTSLFCGEIMIGKQVTAEQAATLAKVQAICADGQKNPGCVLNKYERTFLNQKADLYEEWGHHVNPPQEGAWRRD